MNKKIIIGSANFNQFYGLKKNNISNREIELLIKLAKRHGINKIDTSPSYKGSEKIIGKCAQKGFKINTKIPKIPNIKISEVRKWTNQTIKKSFTNLKVKKINSIIIQNPSILLSKKGIIIYKILRELKTKKKISKIGISIYNLDKLSLILKKFKIDLVQTQLNIFDRRLLQSGWIEKLTKKNIEIQVRSIFLQGLLLEQSSKLPDRLKKYKSYWEKLENWKKKNKMSSLETCISIINKYPKINSLVIGFNNLNQFKEFIRIKNSKKKVPYFKIKNQNIINPIRWLK